EFSIAAIVLAAIFGLLGALIRLARIPVLSSLVAVYVEIFRSTPLLFQMFFIVLGLPSVLPLNDWFGPTFYPLAAGALTLALHEGAYVTEIIRAGIDGVDDGQTEAGRSVGMSSIQTMRHIVLPQAFRRMIPPFVNQSAQTIKDTSLLAPIGVGEMIYKGEAII